MNVTSRDFVGVDDLPVITQFFDETRDLVGHKRSPLHAGDVWWRYGRSEPETHQFRLWFEADKLIGIGWLLFGKNLELHVHPALGDQAIGRVTQEILNWAKSVCSEEAVVESLADNTRFIALLEANGFARYGYDFLMYTVDLDQTIPDVELPPGFKARHVLEAEYPERIGVHQDAFGSTKFTLARYQGVRSTPGYNPKLDLVVATPDQTFAAFCLVWLSNGAGEFEPVGTRAAYRRRGLGRAVILEGFRRLKHMGARTALVFSEPKNRAFYEACGFRVVNQFVGYVFKPKGAETPVPNV
jgi:ribosomal protein S18 acetylase RimI-like enzyme